jgi:hypothetical protein
MRKTEIAFSTYKTLTPTTTNQMFSPYLGGRASPSQMPRTIPTYVTPSPLTVTVKSPVHTHKPSLPPSEASSPTVSEHQSTPTATSSTTQLMGKEKKETTHMRSGSWSSKSSKRYNSKTVKVTRKDNKKRGSFLSNEFYLTSRCGTDSRDALRSSLGPGNENGVGEEKGKEKKKKEKKEKKEKEDDKKEVEKSEKSEKKDRSEKTEKREKSEKKERSEKKEKSGRDSEKRRRLRISRTLKPGEI